MAEKNCNICLWHEPSLTPPCGFATHLVKPCEVDLSDIIEEEKSNETEDLIQS